MLSKHFRTKTSSPNPMFLKKSGPNLPTFVISTLKKDHDSLLKWSLLGKNLHKNRYCKIFKSICLNLLPVIHKKCPGEKCAT